jgi:hypothetical protein
MISMSDTYWYMAYTTDTNADPKMLGFYQAAVGILLLLMGH